MTLYILIGQLASSYVVEGEPGNRSVFDTMFVFDKSLGKIKPFTFGKKRKKRKKMGLKMGGEEEGKKKVWRIEDNLIPRLIKR